MPRGGPGRPLPSAPMNPVELLRALWRRRVIVLAVAVLVVAAAFGFASTQEDVYESSATIALLPDGDNPSTLPFYLGALDNLLPTYAQLIESRSFLDGVATELPFKTNGGYVKSAVTAEPVADAGAMRIIARDADPERAQQMAAATSAAFSAELADDEVLRVRVIDDARLPDSPVGPRRPLIIGTAVILALALGAAAGLVWDRLFGRVTDPRELAEISGLPSLGVLPFTRHLRDRRRIAIGDPELALLEENLRAIRTNVLFAVRADQPGGTIMVSGLNEGDGKSTLAANLAVTVGELGFSVLLIDADMHRPTQHEFFGLTNERGLTSIVLDGADPASLVRSTVYQGVKVVTAGPPLQARAQELTLYLQHLQHFSRMGDVVIVDSPPLKAADEVRLLAAFSGGVVLVLRSGSSSGRQVRSAVAGMEVLGARVLGTVLTQATAGLSVETVPEYYRYRREPQPGQRPGH